MIENADLPSQTRWLPEGDGATRLIVCEQDGRWARALRQHLGASGPRVHETRSLSECWEMLAGHRASFVVVEATRANFEALLERMAFDGRQYPLARMAVVADRALAACEWLVREVGGVHFTTSPRCVGPLACVACRHFEQAPRPRRTLTQRLWDALPWGESGG